MRLLLAVTGFAALALTVTGYTAAHYAGEYQKAQQSLHAMREASAKADLDAKTRYQSVPELRSVQRFGAPYNVTVVCEVTGSSEGAGGRRVPLSLQAGVRPGDLYVKTCRGLASTDPVPAPSS